MSNCIACQHWKLRDKNGKPHGMAQHKMGYCEHKERWRYFGGGHQCDNRKFTHVDDEILKKRRAWAGL